MDFLARLGVAVILIGGAVIALTATLLLWMIATKNHWIAVAIGVGIWLLSFGLARVWIWVCGVERPEGKRGENGPA